MTGRSVRHLRPLSPPGGRDGLHHEWAGTSNPLTQQRANQRGPSPIATPITQDGELCCEGSGVGVGRSKCFLSFCFWLLRNSNSDPADISSSLVTPRVRFLHRIHPTHQTDGPLGVGNSRDIPMPSPMEGSSERGDLVTVKHELKNGESGHHTYIPKDLGGGLRSSCSEDTCVSLHALARPSSPGGSSRGGAPGPDAPDERYWRERGRDFQWLGFICERERDF